MSQRYEDIRGPRAITNDEEDRDRSDGDESLEDDGEVSNIDTDLAEADGVIGISISRVQSSMRSPQLATVEKAQMLNQLDGFWDSNLNQIQSNEAAPSKKSPRPNSPSKVLPIQGPPEDITPQNQPNESNSWQTSSMSGSGFHMQRFSITRTVLGDSQHGNRKRSTSGPIQFLGNIRKFLPELPSGPFLKSSAHVSSKSEMNESQEKEQISRNDPNERIGNTSPWKTQDTSAEGRLRRSESIGQASESTTQETALSLGGNKITSPRSLSSQSLRRANSDGSIYLKKQATGASGFDDTTVYNNITDMANARFKAITDSLQNSSLRLPKLPGIRSGSKQDCGPNDNTGITKRISPQNDAKVQLAAKEKPTSINKFRHGVRDLDIETSQQRAHPILSSALAQTTGDLVIMGGYRGSVLRSANPPQRQVWVPVKVGLNLRKVDLEVGLNRQDEERMEENIIPSGVLSHIGPIDICRRLLRHVKKSPNFCDGHLRMHNYGYDWRLSPDLLCDRFIKFLESLECNQPNTPKEKRGATIIAHSLGGLITRYAVNKRPELFDGVVYAGVPQNCVNILGPLRNGDDVLLSSRVLTAQVNFTFRTSFALLPEDGRCFIQKDGKERYDLDFFDPEIWDEFRLSPCINPPLHSSPVDYRKSLIGSISDTITSSLPSLTPKRSSWFTSHNHSPARDSKDNKPKTHESSTETAFDKLHEPEQTLEPSMKEPHHKTSIATTCTLDRDDAKDYLARTLSEVQSFKTQLNFNPSHQQHNRYPPHAVIFGKTVPTVYGARVTSREAIKYTEAYDDLVFAAGDGVVLASAAQLPEGYRCVKNGRIESDRGHVGLLGDLEAVGTCLHAVIEARRKGVGLEELCGECADT